MRRSVLVVTSDPELGELISTSLRDTHEIDSYRFFDPVEAIAFLPLHRECEYAIIEAEIGEIRIIELVHAMRRINRGIRLILLARSRPAASLDEIQPWRLLRVPFMPAELFALLGVRPLVPVSPELNREAQASPPTWLEDPSVASRTLERLTRTTSIQEAVILREFDLWASSGRLNNASVREIKDMIFRTMGDGQQFDLLRFMRLKGMHAQHGVWAKLLLVNVILAVIYDLDTPISEMRTQTNALADALSRPILSHTRSSGRPELPDLRAASRGTGSRPRMEPSGDDDSSPRQSTLDMIDEAQTTRASGVQPDQAGGKHGNPKPHGGPPRDTAGYLGATASSFARPPGDPRALVPRDDQEFLIQPEASVAEDPAVFDEYGILYSCLLTPRFDTRTLSGHLAALLQRRLPRICISYGWRLESIELLHDCMQWTVRVPPSEAVAEHIAMVRKLTSEYIFHEFPELLRENLSQDFWAPGFSVKAGPEPHTEAQIRSYVRKTRQGTGSGSVDSHSDFLSDDSEEDWTR